MAAITHVFTIDYVAALIREDIDFLHDVAIDMEPEDGRLYIVSGDDDPTIGFTNFGLQCLADFIREYRANHPEAPSAPRAE